MLDSHFPSEHGSYLLWLYLPHGKAITIGRLGLHYFRRGWYFYTGSAFGLGGLRARLGHHLKPSGTCHWHIDYLKKSAGIRSIWICPGVNSEHDWSRRMMTLPTAECPLPGFGASDCRCRSHLVYLPRKPAPQNIRDLLAGADDIGCYDLISDGIENETG